MTSNPRVAAIDTLRGMVIVLMVLDHTRDFFGDTPFSATDLSKTTPALFFTRWVTHLCAPTFIVLAGVSAALSKLRGGARSRFLLQRGLWLVALEFTLVRFAWTFSLDYQGGLIMQVIWAIGVSMIALAALVHLPKLAIAALALLMIFGHDLLDGIRADQLGGWAPLWRVLHESGRTPFGRVVYPLVPWIGVMALGYVLGDVYRRRDRARLLLGLGLASVLSFVLLRASNLYGDPVPWSVQPRGPVFTALSFLNVSKYPPSLSYLLITLGIAALALAALDGRDLRVLSPFGRVPLFAYVVHLLIAHTLAGLLGFAQGFGSAIFTAFFDYPPGWGLPLSGVYAVWLLVLALLWPLCHWFAGVKQRRRDWWLSYL